MPETQNLNSGQTDCKVFLYALGPVYSCKKYAQFGIQIVSQKGPFIGY